jgi:multisubunit Na+/H+ antiporter MnhG subunit
MHPALRVLIAGVGSLFGGFTFGLLFAPDPTGVLPLVITLVVTLLGTPVGYVLLGRAATDGTSE